MSRPTTNLGADRRPDLAAFTEFDLAADRAGFISQRVLPTIEVQKQSGSYGIISIEEMLRNEATNRAPGTGYNRISGGFGRATFETKEQGIEEVIDDREAEMYADFIDAEQVATERARDIVLRNAELRVSSLIFNTSTWTGAALTTATAGA